MSQEVSSISIMIISVMYCYAGGSLVQCFCTNTNQTHKTHYIIPQVINCSSGCLDLESSYGLLLRWTSSASAICCHHIYVSSHFCTLEYMFLSAYFVLVIFVISDPVPFFLIFYQNRPDSRVIKLIKRMGARPIPNQRRVLCMNKIDLVEKKKDLLKVAEEFKDLPGYER